MRRIATDVSQRSGDRAGYLMCRSIGLTSVNISAHRRNQVAETHIARQAGRAHDPSSSAPLR